MKIVGDMADDQGIDWFQAAVPEHLGVLPPFQRENYSMEPERNGGCLVKVNNIENQKSIRIKY